MKKTQIGWVIIVVIALISIFPFLANDNQIAKIIIPSVGLIILLFFYKLTIIVTDKFLFFSMGIGIIKKTYRLNDISICKPITYTPFGWGIRIINGGIRYNVSGNKAIEIRLNNKHKVIQIGTNTPEELSSYINSMKAKENAM